MAVQPQYALSERVGAACDHGVASSCHLLWSEMTVERSPHVLRTITLKRHGFRRLVIATNSGICDAVHDAFRQALELRREARGGRTGIARSRKRVGALGHAIERGFDFLAGDFYRSLVRVGGDE